MLDAATQVRYAHATHTTSAPSTFFQKHFLRACAHTPKDRQSHPPIQHKQTQTDTDTQTHTLSLFFSLSLTHSLTHTHDPMPGVVTLTRRSERGRPKSAFSLAGTPTRRPWLRCLTLICCRSILVAACACATTSRTPSTRDTAGGNGNKLQADSPSLLPRIITLINLASLDEPTRRARSQNRQS